MSEQPTTPQRPPLVRRAEDRAIAGVGAAVARHLGIDPIIVRVVLVALAFAGGAGLLAYVAAWVLIPAEEGGVVRERGTIAGVAGAVLVVAAVAIAMPDWTGPGFGGAVWFLALAGLGGALWYATRGEDRPVARRLGLALVLAGAAGVLAIASFWAAALGGDVAVAIAVVVAGLGLTGAAMAGRAVFPAAWLALAVALPAAFVGAAGLELDGGVGERSYRPAALAEVAERYEIGAGELVVDLRDVDFGGATQRMAIDVGMGAAEVLVPPGVCVGGSARIGAGAVRFTDDEHGGVDLVVDEPLLQDGTAGRLLLDVDVSLGAVTVGIDEDDAWDWEQDRSSRIAAGACA